MAEARLHFLDRPAARVLAAAVCVGCIAALAWLERERFWPTASSGTGANEPFVRCFAERAAQIDRMQADGAIDAARAELFKSRAEAMCRAETAGAGASAPPLPNQ
jgi:hypothetical protein